MGGGFFAEAWPGASPLPRRHSIPRSAPAGSPREPASTERDIAETAAFEREVRALPRVLPTVAFHDTLVMWSGRREFRLMSATGDANGSTILYLPSEKLLVMGDVLVARENGSGPPPWTTNSYSISPGQPAKRRIARCSVSAGQGLAFTTEYSTHDRRLAATCPVRLLG